MPRAVLYTRVSSEEQLEGYSLSAQAEAGQRFAEQRGWELTIVYEERGRSGKNALRPEFQRMIRDAHAGMFDIIIVHKLDRFSRSVLDMFNYLKDLKDINVSLVSITEDFDFTTPIGKILLALLSAFAEWYLDNLRTEVTKGKKERARMGHWNGRLSYGYITPKKLKARLWELGENYKAALVPEADYIRLAALYEDALDNAEGKVETAAVPCPVNADGVRFAFEHYATGSYSDGDISKLLLDAGYRIEGVKGNTLITKDAVEDMLQNRFYLGETSYGRKVPGKKREWLPGAHDPLIDEALFDQCQDVRRQRAARYTFGNYGARRVYPLVPLLVCEECGTTLTGQTLYGVMRYRDIASMKKRKCSQEIKSVVCSEIEGEINALLGKIKLPKDWQERIVGLFPAANSDDEVTERQRKAAEDRLGRAKTLFMLGDIDEREYLGIKEQVVQQLDAMPLPNGTTIVDLKQTLSLLGNLRQILEDATPEERQRVYRHLFTRIMVGHGKVTAFQPTPILWALMHLIKEAGRTGILPVSFIDIPFVRKATFARLVA